MLFAKFHKNRVKRFILKEIQKNTDSKYFKMLTRFTRSNIEIKELIPFRLSFIFVADN